MNEIEQMEVWITIAILGALVLGGLIVFNLLKDKGETATEAHYARRAAPLFFQQPAFGAEFQEDTIAQYKRALDLLKKTGNRLLNTSPDPEKTDVFLWLHRVDKDHPELDFEKWEAEKLIQRKQIMETFEKRIAMQAAAKGQLYNLAEMKTNGKLPTNGAEDFEKDENGEY